ncbi:hypothetical protein ZIOFF_031958 [Zingiber officinale]|uniref:Uncharacterized protein n=1 Tax=Zingiber officinale TaxID=94328 RepID=A0A8J5LB88_ZINOF|nr:hypothetical protein ZIOFF_031958 [Zingiber officinale]
MCPTNDIFGGTRPNRNDLLPPPCITSWEDVSLAEKQLIFDHLDNKFEYEKMNLVMAKVERLAMRAIQEGRCKMRRHWKQLGGLGNKDTPKGSRTREKYLKRILIIGLIGHLKVHMDRKLWFNIITKLLIL